MSFPAECATRWRRPAGVRPKLARLKVIRERLIPAYLEVFDRNKLPEQTAYVLARMETALQERLANMLPNLPTGSRAEELLELAKAGTDWRPAFSCPDGQPLQAGRRVPTA